MIFTQQNDSSRNLFFYCHIPTTIEFLNIPDVINCHGDYSVDKSIQCKTMIVGMSLFCSHSDCHQISTLFVLERYCLK
jgi:hypothetical protein